MKAHSCPQDSNQMSLLPTLVDMIDMRHELVKLTEIIDWQNISIDVTQCLSGSHRGAPALAPRLIVGVLYLQHMYNLSDEKVCATWQENPYWQYFCGEKYFQHNLPFNPSSMTRWRKRLGKDGCEKLFTYTVKAAIDSNNLEQKDFNEVIVDTTVQEKDITFPTDGNLLNNARLKLVKLAKKHA